MKRMANSFLLAILCTAILVACSKSNSGGGSNNNGGSSTSPIFPLATNNSWYYKFRNYDTVTGLITDSSYFTINISGTVTANGTTYYEFQHSPDTAILSKLGLINATTLGSIDDAYGTKYNKFFIAGKGDSTSVVDSWPVKVAVNGSACEGTDKLFAFYADTTLVNLDGTVYTGSKKNVIETYDCSGNKLFANLYYIKAGTGLVRFAKYVYNKSGKPVLQLAWVLESETLN